jgi:type 2 lantibiotic biosynthesis protein LanM
MATPGRAPADLRVSLARIAARTQSLSERLARCRVPGPEPAPEPGPAPGPGPGTREAAERPEAARRWEAWIQAVAKGDREAFGRFLAWSGVDGRQARAALATVCWPPGAPLPPWADLLGECLAEAQGVSPPGTPGASGPGGDRACDPADPLPFEDVLLPFLRVARRHLARRASGAGDLLADAAWVALERELLADLTHLAVRVLHLEFDLFRRRSAGPFERKLRRTLNPDDRATYLRFVATLAGPGLARLLEEYAVLGRQLAQFVLCWVDAHAELLARLAADRAELGVRFGTGGDPGHVVEILAGLSDPHRGRRRVVALAFENGVSAVYKPKDMGVAAAFDGLLAWLDEQDLTYTLGRHPIWDRGDYGWCGFVPHRPCDSRDEAHGFYHRAGMLLALVYLLCGGDCHRENVVACGADPVLIDLETLIQPRLRQDPGLHAAFAQALAAAHLDESVLTTGFLPEWRVSPGGYGLVDVGALCGAGGLALAGRIPQWRHVNCDGMAIELVEGQTAPGPHSPRLGDEALTFGPYIADVLAGFRELYDVVGRQRDEWLAPGGAACAFAGQEVRVVFRHTALYVCLLEEALAPERMRDGVDRSLSFAKLARALVGPGEAQRPRTWPILEGELAALEQGDVPFFTVRTDATDLTVPGLPGAADAFEVAGLARVRERLAEMGQADLDRQLGFIKASLLCYRASAAPPLSVPGTGATADAGTGATADPGTGGQRGGMAMPDAAGWLAAAVAIGEELESSAIWAPDGSATWIAPQAFVMADRFRLAPLGVSLYDGACGVAIFGAALGKVTRDPRWRRFVAGALKALRGALHRSNGSSLNPDGMGIGATAGLGSLVYALDQCGRLLADPAIRADALAAAGLITPERIAADRGHDVCVGTAGAILALLAVDRSLSRPDLRARALACGRKLLASRVALPSGLRTWPAFDRMLLSGLSHGAAGVAYALCRLHTATGQAEFRDAAAEAIAAEQAAWEPAAGNWRSQLAGGDEGEPAYFGAWCHGAPGIALARLGGLESLATPEIHQDVARGLDYTLTCGLEASDNACCGNMGRAEILLEAARALSRPDLQDAGRRLAAAVLARREEAGGYRFDEELQGAVSNPGFFMGVSGIGYCMLRQGFPDELPCVHLWA